MAGAVAHPALLRLSRYRRATGPLTKTIRLYETRITIISAIWG